MKMQLHIPTRSLTVEHLGETISFGMSFYQESKRESGNIEALDPFREINTYVGTKPADYQNHVFNFFKATRHILDHTLDTVDLNRQLSDEIAKLYDIIDLDDVSHWVTFHALGKTIVYPDGIPDSYNDIKETSLVTRERTYLKPDYKELICFVIVLRLIAPIWSEYAQKIKNEYGNQWKEYYAFKLLHKSKLMESPALVRLTRYVECSIPKQTNLNSAIVGGLSTEDYPIWLLATAVLRRVVMGDITGTMTSSNDPTKRVSLVIVIYKLIESKIQQTDSSFVGTVRTKNPPSEKQSDMDTMSTLETYNTRQEIADGYMEMFNTYLEDPVRVALHLDPTIPISLIQESCHPELLRELHSSEIMRGQLTITQWVLNKVVSARALDPDKAIDFVEKNSLVNAIAAVRAYLWHRGHYELAALMSAIPTETGNFLPVVGADSRLRIPKEIQDELAVQFPYYRHVVGRTQKPVLNIINCINNVHEYFTCNHWRLTIPESWINQGRIRNQGVYYSVQENIKLSLAMLALELSRLESDYITDDYDFSQHGYTF